MTFSRWWTLGIGAVVLAACSVETSGPALDDIAPTFSQAKVDVCHRTTAGNWNLISVADPALPAHIDHGDAVPGAAVPGMAGYNFDEGCNPVEVPEPIIVLSAFLNFSSTGWGGWSCPAGSTILGATVQKLGGDALDHPVASITLWKPGATAGGVNYPNTPSNFATYIPPEEGAIVQNGGIGQSIQIVLTCVPQT